MGGEFYLALRKDNAVTPDSWALALREIVEQFDEEEDKDHHFSTTEFAFSYEDPVHKWGGTNPQQPKHFRLKYEWGDDAIQNGLGGRHRTDWSLVARVCKALCDEFPGDMALVVSDGISGYNDDAGTKFYEWTPQRKWQDVNYGAWPWTDYE